MDKQTPPRRLLRLPSVLDRVSHSRTEWYRRVKAGTAPSPIKLGVRSVAWLEGDIDAYIKTLADGETK